MSVLGLAYERVIFQLLDLKTKKVFEFSHHSHLKPIGQDLAKLFTKCMESALTILKPFLIRKSLRHSYHALGAFLSP
jgi:hypothetical protein